VRLLVQEIENMKKVLIAGSTGMIGGLILDECLNRYDIEEVRVINRKSLSRRHPKLNEVIVSNFSDFSLSSAVFEDIDMAFFCVGVYSGQVKDDLLKEITVTMAIAFGSALAEGSPQANFCFLSRAGADRSEKSRISFARYKGMAENKLATFKSKGSYFFRPVYIYPVQARKEPNAMYRLRSMLYPIIKLKGVNSSIRSTQLASAMIKVGFHGFEEQILENRDIVMVANRSLRK
jgi:uncharacterized protein YbjT (DUF2867 family)